MIKICTQSLSRKGINRLQHIKKFPEEYAEYINPHNGFGQPKHLMVVAKFRTEFILFRTHQSHAYAYCVELLDGNYELVPEADEDLANAGVNAVEVQQGPDQSS
jgi:hypothetical protein